MHTLLYRILSYLIVAGFVLYWSCIITLTLPANSVKEQIGNELPRFKLAFTNSWKLFTSPAPYNYRLYFIVRNTNQPGSADTMEVLQNIYLQKQARVPFNQNEHVREHLLSSHITGLVKLIWGNKDMIAAAEAGLVDSAFIAQGITGAQNKRYYPLYVSSLYNYCWLILKENKQDIKGKEVKIIIKEKTTMPFNSNNIDPFQPKEVTVFETNYKPIKP